MAQLPGAFNANDHDEMEEKGDFPALPKDDYGVRIKETSSFRNSKDTGDCFKFVFEVLDGKYKGRLLFANLNLVHENPAAVEMAEKELGSMVRAVGKVTIDDTDDLVGCQLTVSVTVKKATSKYPEGNEIAMYKPLDGAAQPSAGGSKAKAKAKKKVSFS